MGSSGGRCGGWKISNGIRKQACSVGIVRFFELMKYTKFGSLIAGDCQIFAIRKVYIATTPLDNCTLLPCEFVKSIDK